MVSPSVLGTCVGVTILCTLYSLSQLHTLSVQHAAQDASLEEAAQATGEGTQCTASRSGV